MVYMDESIVKAYLGTSSLFLREPLGRPHVGKKEKAVKKIVFFVLILYLACESGPGCRNHQDRIDVPSDRPVGQ